MTGVVKKLRNRSEREKKKDMNKRKNKRRINVKNNYENYEIVKDDCISNINNNSVASFTYPCV